MTVLQEFGGVWTELEFVLIRINVLVNAIISTYFKGLEMNLARIASDEKGH